MIYQAKGYIEMRTVPSTRVDLVANRVELTWLTRYPLPSKVITDKRNEFLANFREVITNDYGIR